MSEIADAEVAARFTFRPSAPLFAGQPIRWHGAVSISAKAVYR